MNEITKIITENTENNDNITPAEYFEKVKGKKNQVNDKILDDYYANCLQLISKYKKTGQVEALKKLIFITECVEKERALVLEGVDSFVYRDDVFEFIEDISDKPVKIIELENYSRDIPDEVVERLERVRPLFDEFYVLFTDYTGEEERKIKEEEKEKDPILFGIFTTNDNGMKIINDKMYAIGDWEDEYCDLTMDKLVGEFAKLDRQVEYKIQEPVDIEELKKQIYSQHEPVEVKTNFFDKFKSFFKKE